MLAFGQKIPSPEDLGREEMTQQKFESVYKDTFPTYLYEANEQAREVVETIQRPANKNKLLYFIFDEEDFYGLKDVIEKDLKRMRDKGDTIPTDVIFEDKEAIRTLTEHVKEKRFH